MKTDEGDWLKRLNVDAIKRKVREDDDEEENRETRKPQ